MTSRRDKREAARNRAYARAMLWVSLGALAVAGLLFMARTPVDELSRSTPKTVLEQHTEAQEVVLPSTTTSTQPPMATEDSADTVRALHTCQADGLSCNYEPKPNGGGEVIGTPKVAPTTTTTTVAAYEPVPTTQPNPDTDCTAHSADPFSC